MAAGHAPALTAAQVHIYTLVAATGAVLDRHTVAAATKPQTKGVMIM